MLVSDVMHLRFVVVCGERCLAKLIRTIKALRLTPSVKFRNIYGTNSIGGRGQITNTRDKFNKSLHKAQRQKTGLGLVKVLSAPSKGMDMKWQNPVTMPREVPINTNTSSLAN